MPKIKTVRGIENRKVVSQKEWLVARKKLLMKKLIVALLAAGVGVDWANFIREAPGLSAFALEDGVVYHTYSAYARGLDGLWAAYQWLDRAPKGRNETGLWFRRHDEYDKGASKDCCA